MMPERKNMYADRILYQKSGDKSYLVIRSGEESELPYQINMIKYNNISGLLPIQFFIEDGEYRYFYDISCKESLEERMKQKKYSIQEIRTVMACLYRCVQQLEDYLLDINCIILDPEYLFTERGCFDIQFCFYQDKKETFEKSLEKLFDYFLNRLDYQDEKTVVFMYSLYQKMKEENVSLYELMKQFCEIQEKGNANRVDEISGDVPGDIEAKEAYESNRYKRREKKAEKEIFRKKSESIRKNSSNISWRKVIPYIPDVIGGYGIAGILWHVGSHYSQMSGKIFMMWMFAVAGILAGCGIFSTFLSEFSDKKTDGESDRGKERMSGKNKAKSGEQDSVKKNYQQMRKRPEMKETDSIRKYEWKTQNIHKMRNVQEIQQAKEMQGTNDGKDDALDAGQTENEAFDEFRFEEEPEQDEMKKSGLIPATVVMSEPELFKAYNPVLVSKDKENFHDIVLKEREMMVGKVHGITDICLEGKSISRVHARISQDQEGCSITDLGSTNGTYINGIRLAERQKKYLQEGDEVRIAEAVFIFQTEEKEILRSQRLSDVI
ncbi:MAG: DUF6382 domain-containing protein [Blautia sp.]